MTDLGDLEQKLLEGGRRRRKIMKVGATVISVCIFILSVVISCAASYGEWSINNSLNESLQGD